jgi:DNA-damage-inducible protein J
MGKTAVVQIRIDRKTKADATRILNALDLTMSEAVSLYLRQISLRKGIPFALKVPNRTTARTLQKARQGKGLHKAEDVDRLFEDLER